MKGLNYLKGKWRFLIAFVVRRYDIESVNNYFQSDKCGMLHGRCSKCKGEFVQPFNVKFDKYRYCPMCGVKFK